MAKETLDLDVSRALAQIQGLDTALSRAAGHFSDAISRAVAQLHTGVDVPVHADTASIPGKVSGAVDAADTTATVDLDTAAAEQNVGLLTRGLNTLKDEVKGIAAAFAIAFATKKVGEFFIESIQASSRLNEAQNKTNIVFEEGAQIVRDFAATAASDVGLVSSEALDGAASFGTLFREAGSTGEESARLSTRLVTLAADLASVNDTEVPETLLRLRSGLIGEVEPLRQLNVMLNATEVEAKALEMRVDGVTGELTEGEKVQARYALILEKTARFHGDFANTSEDLANAQRRLKAAFGEVQVQVGNELTPIIERLIGVAGRDALPIFEDLTVELARLGGTALPIVANAGGALLPLLQVLSQLLSVIPADVAEGVLTFMSLARILPTVSAGMGAGVTAVAAFLPLLRDVSPEAADAVTSIAFLAAAGFRLGGPGAGGAIGAAIGGLVGLVSALVAGKTAAEKAADAIDEVSAAGDRAVKALAEQKAAEIARAATIQDQTGLVKRLRQEEIAVLREMASEGEKGAGAAVRLGQAYVEAGVITEKQYNRILKDTVAATKQVTETTEEGSGVLDEAKDAYEKAGAAADAYTDALDRTLGINLSAFEAQRSYQDALRETQFALATTAGTVDLNTEAGRVNADTIADGAHAASAYADAIIRQGGSAAEADAVLRSYADSVLATVPAGSEARAALEDLLVELHILPGAAAAAGAGTAKGFGDPIKTGLPQAMRDGTNLAKVTLNDVARLVLNGAAQSAGRGAGINFALGMSNGIDAGTKFIKAAAERAVRAAKKAADDAAGNASPSKLFAEVGQNMGAGLALGFADAGAQVVAEAERIVAQAARVGAAPVGVSGVVNITGGQAPTASTRSAPPGVTVVVVRDGWEARPHLPDGTGQQVDTFLAGR